MTPPYPPTPPYNQAHEYTKQAHPGGGGGGLIARKQTVKGLKSEGFLRSAETLDGLPRCILANPSENTVFGGCPPARDELFEFCYIARKVIDPTKKPAYADVRFQANIRKSEVFLCPL